MEREIVIVANRWMTPDGTILHSKHRNDYVSHLDLNGEEYFVDGGNDYIRMSVNTEKMKSMMVYSDAPWEVQRTVILRGSRGKSCNEPLKWIPLCDIDDEYLENIISYCDLYGGPKEHYEKEREYRNTLKSK